MSFTPSVKVASAAPYAEDCAKAFSGPRDAPRRARHVTAKAVDRSICKGPRAYRESTHGCSGSRAVPPGLGWGAGFPAPGVRGAGPPGGRGRARGDVPLWPAAAPFSTDAEAAGLGTSGSGGETGAEPVPAAAITAT